MKNIIFFTLFLFLSFNKSLNLKNKGILFNVTMNLKLIASSDIVSSLVIGHIFKGKVVKEVYRCNKVGVLTGSVTKPSGFVVSTIPTELSKGIVYTVVGQVGETVIRSISDIGFVQYLYKIAQSKNLKASARLIYNVACLPITLYSKEIGGVFDLIGISKVEELWFGEPVYIFDDNRL